MTNDVIGYQMAALGGSIVAFAFATILPYFKKWLETKEIVGSELKFDKKFMVTGGIAFVFAMFAGLINFESTETQIDYNSTILKVFVTAFITGIGFNFGINQWIKPSSTVVTAFRNLKQRGSVE
jgi:uncharacterized protein YacL